MLLTEPYRPRRVFLTGGTGYVGALIAAKLLLDPELEAIIVPTRRAPEHGPLAMIATELAALGVTEPEAMLARLSWIRWKDWSDLAEPAFMERLAENQLDTIIHAAGCVDYFDSAALESVNVELTRLMLALGKTAAVSRFVYVSTAYSAGYLDHPIPEAALGEPLDDPTDYTRSKRAAEQLVAASGLPFVIARPSIIIGNHSDGRYSGKRYGLYQQWMGLERLMLDRYHADIHTVATDAPLNLIHQDVFQSAFDAALRWVPDGAYINLVTDSALAPSTRDVWELWAEVAKPANMFYYEQFDDVDLKAIHMRQRAYLTFAKVNLEISAHPWCFERGWLYALQAKGMPFQETTLASVGTCQSHFIAGSTLIPRYRERFSASFAPTMNVVECGARIPQYA
ncbi:MAG: SDR family oxidoreductase [Pseudomonadota bacterium]